jgi:predicted metal-dependent hydrolase
MALEFHPLILRGQTIPHALQARRNRRQISLSVDERGLVIHVPTRVRPALIQTAIDQHAQWIVDQYQRQRTPPRLWCDGERIMFCGKPLTLIADATITQALQLNDPADTLHFHSDLNGAALARIIHQWLQQQALTTFATHCHQHCQQLQLNPCPVQLSNARTRWGSCHRKGHIRINWRLIQAPHPWMRYVTAHEVAHLRHMNHSSAFWQTVATLDPDYQQHRLALRRQARDYLWL